MVLNCACKLLEIMLISMMMVYRVLECMRHCDIEKRIFQMREDFEKHFNRKKKKDNYYSNMIS